MQTDYILHTEAGDKVGSLEAMALPGRTLLAKLWVHPDWRGQGLARRLLGNAVDGADHDGVVLESHPWGLQDVKDEQADAELYSGSGNVPTLPRAHLEELYRSLGFVPVDDSEGFHRWLRQPVRGDSIPMQLHETSEHVAAVSPIKSYLPWADLQGLTPHQSAFQRTHPAVRTQILNWLQGMGHKQVFNSLVGVHRAQNKVDSLRAQQGRKSPYRHPSMAQPYLNPMDMTMRIAAAIPDESGLKAAGIAVIAMDTGRVLMQQRALNPMMCPCGTGVTWDEMNGYQHDDGSVSHDGEFYGQSVSDLLDQGHPEEYDSNNDTGLDQEVSNTNDHEHIDEAGLDKTAAIEFDPNEGTWEFPGGKLDDGESPRAAAAREFREEVGQDLPPGVFVGAWVSPGGISVSAAVSKVAIQPGDQSYGFQDIQGGHTAPVRGEEGNKNTLDNMDDIMPDYLEHPEYYHHGNAGEWEAYDKARKARGNPDKKVRIYRAVPHGITKIYGNTELAHMFSDQDPTNLSEWVSTSKEYVQEHARAEKCPKCKGQLQVVTGIARAGELVNEGYPTEFGYVGDRTLDHTGANRIYKTKCPAPRAPRESTPKAWTPRNPQPGHYQGSLVSMSDYSSQPPKEDLEWLNGHGSYMGWKADTGFGNDSTFWARDMPNGTQHFMIWSPMSGTWGGDVVNNEGQSLLGSRVPSFESARAAHHGLNIVQDAGGVEKQREKLRAEKTPESFQGYNPTSTVEHVTTPHGIKHDLFQRLNGVIVRLAVSPIIPIPEDHEQKLLASGWQPRHQDKSDVYPDFTKVSPTTGVHHQISWDRDGSGAWMYDAVVPEEGNSVGGYRTVNKTDPRRVFNGSGSIPLSGGPEEVNQTAKQFERDYFMGGQHGETGIAHQFNDRSQFEDRYGDEEPRADRLGYEPEPLTMRSEPAFERQRAGDPWKGEHPEPDVSYHDFKVPKPGEPWVEGLHTNFFDEPSHSRVDWGMEKLNSAPHTAVSQAPFGDVSDFRNMGWSQIDPEKTNAFEKNNNGFLHEVNYEDSPDSPTGYSWRLNTLVGGELVGGDKPGDYGDSYHLTPQDAEAKTAERERQWLRKGMGEGKFIAPGSKPRPVMIPNEDDRLPYGPPVKGENFSAVDMSPNHPFHPMQRLNAVADPAQPVLPDAQAAQPGAQPPVDPNMMGQQPGMQYDPVSGACLDRGGETGLNRMAAKAPVYKGFIYLIQFEKDIDLSNRQHANPDDPDGDMTEQSAWWDLDHAKKNPALRPEVKKGTPWGELELWADKSVRNNREVKEAFVKLAAPMTQDAPQVHGVFPSGEGSLNRDVTLPSGDWVAKSPQHNQLNIAEHRGDPGDEIYFLGRAGEDANMEEFASKLGHALSDPGDEPIAPEAVRGHKASDPSPTVYIKKYPDFQDMEGSEKADSHVDTPRGKLLGYFHSVLGDGDKKNHHNMGLSGGKPVSIDHTMSSVGLYADALRDRAIDPEQALRMRWHHEFGLSPYEDAHFLGHDANGRPARRSANPLAPGDTDRAVAAAETMRPWAQGRGVEPWLDAAQKRMRMLGDRAGGTESMFPYQMVHEQMQRVAAGRPPSQQDYSRIREKISEGRPDLGMRMIDEMPVEHHDAIVGSDHPMYHANLDQSQPMVYALRNNGGHTFLAPVYHNQTGEDGWLRGSTKTDPSKWKFYQEHDLGSAIAGQRSAGPAPLTADERYVRQRATGKPAEVEGDVPLDEEGHQVVEPRRDFWKEPEGMYSWDFDWDKPGDHPLLNSEDWWKVSQ